MLTILEGRHRISRRKLLSIGSLGVVGLSLQSLCAARANAGKSRSPLTGKAVIFLFQQG